MSALEMRTPDALRLRLPLTQIHWNGCGMHVQEHWCECADTALLKWMVCVDIKNIFTFMRCVAKTAHTTHL